MAWKLKKVQSAIKNVEAQIEELESEIKHISQLPAEHEDRTKLDSLQEIYNSFRKTLELFQRQEQWTTRMQQEQGVLQPSVACLSCIPMRCCQRSLLHAQAPVVAAISPACNALAVSNLRALH